MTTHEIIEITAQNEKRISARRKAAKEDEMFKLDTASKAIKLIARDETDMFGEAVGYEPAAEGGAYITFACGERRYYSAADIENAATSARC